MSNTIKILEKKQNPLLDRMELALSIYHPKSSTPPKKEIAQLLSEQLSASVDNIIVRDCFTRFGTHISSASAKIYGKKASLERIEHKYVLERILKEKEGKEVAKIPRKVRKEEKNKKKKIRGTMAAYLKKANKRQEAKGG
ncbi:small subunit ribosomal protein S24e [Nematocida sp. LUAm3]|nr:small subunit ribosomal protein S24e [Nematocida sp. LUAm3]KAI5175730.1 small subunit ribosomal protein S24e [Nematocida sp. LUAm2]KAI5178636.1 small subunit ribosomal protein S24e [Nematocida sp. LUAm1]